MLLNFGLNSNWNSFLLIQLTASHHNDLTPKRRQAITCTDGDPIRWRVYVYPDHDELNDLRDGKFRTVYHTDLKSLYMNASLLFYIFIYRILSKLGNIDKNYCGLATKRKLSSHFVKNVKADNHILGKITPPQDVNNIFTIAFVTITLTQNSKFQPKHIKVRKSDIFMLSR